MPSTFPTLPHKDLLTVSQLSTGEIESLFATAAELKANRDLHTDLLERKRIAMIFEKDSLRTRFTFDIGVTDLGGQAVFMDHRDARIGSRESIKDVARNLERWVDGIVAREEFGVVLGFGIPPDIAKMLGDAKAVRHRCG